MESQPPWDDEIERFKSGDQDAAQRMVEALYSLVIKIVRSHKHRTDDEQDLAQEIFMKVFSKIDQYAHAQPFPHWVSRIAVNTCYDRLRRHKSRKVFSYSELSAEEGDFLEHAMAQQGDSNPATDDTGSPLAFGDSAEELVARLLECLNPREQMAIRMLDLEEKSVREVCDLTGWGESKVKVTAYRARKKLTEALKRLEAQAV